MNFKGFDRPTENYSKLPHSFIDSLPEMDTVAELKVVLYLLRHTWGFSEFGKPKKLTTDEFANGRKRRDQSRMDAGTGLSENSVRAGLAKAVEHGFILVEIDETDKARIEKWYCLNMGDDSNIESRGANFEGLGANFAERTEKETIERKENVFTPEEQAQNEAKFQALMQNQREYENRNSSGTAWRGRELLAPQHFVYGDWWHSKTGLHMYGSKGKAKADTGWIKEFQEWYENDVTILSLEEAYKANEWRSISKPAQLTADAKKIQAAPIRESQQPAREEGKHFYV